MTGTTELTTERLLMRRYHTDDARSLYEKFGCDPQMYEYSGWNPYATQDMAKETVHRFTDSYKNTDFYGWAIDYQGQLIGTIGAYDYDAEQNQIEIGMSIERPSWGKGFATEALKKVLEYTQVVKDSPYDYLDTYGHIFLQDYANSVESIFAVQHSNKADDGTQFGRANWSNMLNGVWGIWSCGWDFHKPSQNLVNAFKTRNGLPMDNFDEDHNAIVVNGADSKYKYDPRLFHTVGMPSYPYKYEAQYTLTKANSRTPNTYGYYCSMKEIPQRSKGESYDYPWQAFGQNDYVLRYTDVMLMRAEALIESGDYNGEALQIINTIRERAKRDISSTSLIKYAKDQCEISLYGNFASKEDARKALRWERRLELAMEGHRFFDLRRWGLLSTTLNKYFETEKTDEYDGQTYGLYYKDAFFTKGKNEYFPIASNQMNYVQGLYHQNKGY